MKRRLVLNLAIVSIFLISLRAGRADEANWEKFPDGSTGKVTEYKAAKDTLIAAYLRKPKGDGPFPVVLMIHGGGESKDGTYALGRMKSAPTANFIAEGWAVYSLDFRPKSPFQPIEWDDACLAVETVRKLPFIDGKRVAMIGGSHGGYNTARVASRCDLSCAIPCAPAAIDLLEVFKAKQTGLKLSPNLERVLARKEQELGASMAQIMQDPAKFKWESPLTEAAKARCPILLISGKNDASSPPSVMVTYAEKLKDAGKEVDLYLPENGPHGFYFGSPRIPETDEAARRAVAFIRKHFGLPAKKDEAPRKDDAPTKATPQPSNQPAAPADARVLSLFKKLDTNSDGTVAGDETKSEPAKRFLRLFDKNGDSVVTRVELGSEPTPKQSARPAERGKAQPSQPANPNAAGGRNWVDRGASENTTAKAFHSDTIKGDVSYVIYLPPSYDKEQDRRYPVVYWLHGGRGSQRDCGKFVEVTDKAIRDGKCPEMIVVGVNGLGGNHEFPGSQYSDWKDGSLPMESVIVTDLLPHIDTAYRTLGTREGRALEGFSMGGHGALHLAFRYPDLFGVVTAIGPALIMPGDGGNRVQWVYEKGAYKGDKEYWLSHDPLTVVEKNVEKIRGKMFIRLITGEVEGNFTHRRTVELSKALEKLKIERDFVRPGETGHNYVKVYEAMPKGYEFYAKALGKLTPQAKEPPVPPAKESKEETPADNSLSKRTHPEPPVCYDITKSFPGEIGQYRVSRTAKPVEPFEIMDGLYYVGNTQVSAHLLTTKDGLVLIDTTMPHEVPWLLESIRTLGFKPSDVKVVIGTHAHLDHIGGHWYFQKHFGAQTWLQVEDAADTESGAWKPGKRVELDGTIGTLSRAFPPFKTDRPLRDGEVVEWGGRKLTFRRAPGHTPGTLMIEFPLQSKDGKTYRGGMLGGMSPGRPEFTATCKKLRELDIEVWLGAHPEQNKTPAKADKLKDGKDPNPFIDQDGWKKFLDMMIARGK